MQTSVRQMYLETEVMTATPQKLQLMLIEGAIRYAQRAKTLWSDGEGTAASEAVLRAQEILGELMQSASGTKNEITERISAIYLFLFSKLTEAYLQQDPQRIDEVVSVLEIERETWRQVCEKFGARRDAADCGSAPTAIAPAIGVAMDNLPGGLSLEA